MNENRIQALTSFILGGLSDEKWAFQFPKL